MRFLILLAGFLGTAFARTGSDSIDYLTSYNFQCMVNAGDTFFIGRVFHSNGQVDTVGVQNIKNAWLGGMKYVDGYIFPCTTCSMSAAAQAQAAVNGLNGVQFGMLWIDVEIYRWSTNLQTNRNFITEMGNQLTLMGVNWGVLTNANDWKAIVGLDWTAMSNKSLWWASFNGQANFNNFQPFGGWTKPGIHQYQGNVAVPCGYTANLNWYT